MLTELDVTIPDLADIYRANRWYPVHTAEKAETVDVEQDLRRVLQDLLRYIVTIPEKDEGVTGTMRLHLEKDPYCNMATLYLNIGTVEW